MSLTTANTSGDRISASEVLGALSFALDLTDGQQMGHSMQSCLIGMRIGEMLGLPVAQLSDLYYSLILKDAGCSSNSSKLFHLLAGDEISAKEALKGMDWTRGGLQQLRYALRHMATGQPLLRRLQHIIKVSQQPPQSQALYALRCERGASIARCIGFSAEVALAIANLDEHWDGSGYPMRLSGHDIPLLSRIMNLSQTLAVFWCQGGPGAAMSVMKQRAGRWFDPELVQVAGSLIRCRALFLGLDDADLVSAVAAVEPAGVELLFTEDAVDCICNAFAEVIDTKSPYTFRHSTGVSKAAVAIAEHLGCSQQSVTLLRRAGLLHDIGKLAVPNSILEKPGKLDAAEWQVIRKHPEHSQQILQRVPGFTRISEVAATHHERLDGKGYFRGLQAGALDQDSRILAVADVYDALAAERPYRKSMPREKVFSVLRADCPHSLDADCVHALSEVAQEQLALPAVVLPQVLEVNDLPALAPMFA